MGFGLFKKAVSTVTSGAKKTIDVATKPKVIYQGVKDGVNAVADTADFAMDTLSGINNIRDITLSGVLG